MSCWVTDGSIIVLPGRSRLRGERYCLNDKYISNIQKDTSINILTSEKSDNYIIGKDIMCNMLVNTTRENYTDEFIDNFATIWHEKVYTQEHFPLTYDPIKTLNISSEILYNYKKDICQSPVSINMWSLLWYSLLPIGGFLLVF